MMRYRHLAFSSRQLKQRVKALGQIFSSTRVPFVHGPIDQFTYIVVQLLYQCSRLLDIFLLLIL